MAGRYHPLYDGIWNDERFEGAPFEQIGFFVYLFANPRQRPSGIYRVTDEQIASDTRVALRKARHYLSDLHKRQAILRDGIWIFIKGYFGRQPKTDRLLRAVEKDVYECSSVAILEAFGQKYSPYSRWSADRLKTFTGPSGDLRAPPKATSTSTSTSTSNATSTRPSPEGLGDVPTVAHATWSIDPQTTVEQMAEHEGKKQRARELLRAAGLEPPSPAETS